ncbi:MAG: peptidase M3, partial [Planctomycetota bacterium]
MTTKPICMRCIYIFILILITTVRIANAQTSDNSLLQDWDTPFGAPPFERIGVEDFEPAFETAMKKNLAEIDAICSSSDSPTFANTIEAIENAGEDLRRVQRTFSALTSSATNDELRSIQSRLAPRLAAHASKITLNADLFARIDALFEKRETLGLDDEKSRVLELTHKRFVRAGAKLQGEDRKRLAAITKELAGLYT